MSSMLELIQWYPVIKEIIVIIKLLLEQSTTTKSTIKGKPQATLCMHYTSTV